MKNYRWNSNKHTEDDKLRVYLFVSRNKDNKEIENFHERRYSFVGYDSNYDSIHKRFNDFVNHGIIGEMSRLYRSVNARDESLVYKNFLASLIIEDGLHLDSIEPFLAGVAARKECAAEKKWLLDFDNEDKDSQNEFIKDVKKELSRLRELQTLKHPDIILEEDVIDRHETPHGLAVIVNHGFDTRELTKKWGDAFSVKKDDLLFMDKGIKKVN